MVLTTFFPHKDNRIVSFLVMLFCASLLSTKSGYSYVLAILAIYSFWQIDRHTWASLQVSERWVLVWMGVFSVVGIVAAAWHHDQMDAYEVPAKFALGTVLALAMCARPPKAEAFGLGLVLGTTTGFAVAYWKMLQSGEFKAYGYTGAIQFGNLSLTMGVMLLAALCWVLFQRVENRRFWIVLLAIGCTTGALGSYFSGTRGGWVAIPVFIILFLVSYLRNGNKLSCFIAVSAIILAGWTVFYLSPMVQDRVQGVTQDIIEYQKEGLESSSSIGARFVIWQTSLDILKEKPLLGWGEVKFKQELKRRADEGLIGSVPATLANTHNTFLDSWVRYGGLSVVALVILMISSAWHFLKYLRHWDHILRCYALMGSCLVFGYVVYSQTQVMLIRNNTLMFFILMLSVLIGLIKRRRQEILNNKSTRENE